MRPSTMLSDNRDTFYLLPNVQALRLGDVVQGFVSVTPNVNEQILSTEDHNYSVDIQLPTFSVVLTPCCSIADQTISLTPLTKVRYDFFNNPYFAKDLTRLNSIMSSQYSVHPKHWENMGPEEKAQRLAKGKMYACIEVFIYQEHKLLPSYELGSKNPRLTGYYMIDFKAAYKLNCDKITRKLQDDQETPIQKYLQLTVNARKKLRDKIAAYYSRIPEDD